MFSVTIHFPHLKHIPQQMARKRLNDLLVLENVVDPFPRFSTFGCEIKTASKYMYAIGQTALIASKRVQPKG